MKEIAIDFSGIATKEELHDLLQEKLELPEYYGRNMDALFDCLSTDIHEPTCVTLSGLTDNSVPALCAVMLNVFYEAEEENEHLTVDADPVTEE